ncbi:cobalamin B12-binding domain-containing protein [Holophaga foetida]|uniref:cobalamin B12-binding domain-containing protein n=1 Tax=Holophaga foetida TaxID=35839 RepID=UPI0002471CC5|nr:cobalamin-dependent protein [Holophaga foetida]
MPSSLVDEFANLAEASTLERVKELLDSHQKAADILVMLQMGMEIVSRRYERGEYAVADMIVASDIFANALGILGLGPSRPRAGRMGSILIGTVYDGHELGKNLLGAILGAAGLRVIDLGVRVQPVDFQRAVRHYHPKFVGISCASSLGFQVMRYCVEAVRRADLRNEIRILVGGSACDESSAAWAGADVFCRTPREAVAYCRALRSKWTVIPGGSGHSPAP